MKGTAPRGRWPEEDRAVAERLLASAKDRAENAMIVDLLRNDLGRISRTGSVTWADVFQAERWGTEWQLHGTAVWSELESGVAVAGVFRGLFPSGSVTGAPEEGPDDADHQRARGLPARHLLRRGRLPGAGWIRASARSLQRRDPHRDRRHRLGNGGIRSGRWHHVGLRRRSRCREEAVAKTRVLTARRPGFELLETMRHDATDGTRGLEGTSGACRSRPTTSVSGTTRPRCVRRWRRPWRPAGHAVRVRLALTKDGTARVVCTPLASDPDVVRVALDDVPQDTATCSCSTRPRGASNTRTHPAAIPTPTTSSS